VLDIYVSIRHGATLVIVEEGLGKEPLRLAPWIAEKRISIWYSAPSILSMMAQFGKLEQSDYSALRMVLFAGEVFPIRHLRLLKSLWRHPRYFNLYGPTETNVCTWYEVPQDISESQTEPVPIGRRPSLLSLSPARRRSRSTAGAGGGRRRVVHRRAECARRVLGPA
jgi:acyl-coenzyme A synthetase/AMP-(fatty) acid ligase